ncbi:MAG: hypothetical protein KC503_29250 [Myxococcales bacterium]|nr:hypothetical protein [Myxococcales bacterium]
MSKRAKKAAEEKQGSSLEWLLTFSDVLTLLITFFVLLISMSSMDSKRLRETFGFFRGALGSLGSSKGNQRVQKVDTQHAQMNPMKLLNRRLASGTGYFEASVERKLATIHQASMRLERALKINRRMVGMSPLRTDLARILEVGPPVRVVRTPRGRELWLNLPLFFERGQVEARELAHELVRAVGQLAGHVESVVTPVREHGVASRIHSPWALAIWRSAYLVRKLRRAGAVVAATAVKSRRRWVRVVLRAPTHDHKEKRDG